VCVWVYVVCKRMVCVCYVIPSPSFAAIDLSLSVSLSPKQQRLSLFLSLSLIHHTTTTPTHPCTRLVKIVYPDDVGSQTCSDRSLEEVLEAVGLGYLVEEWGLNRIHDWDDLLSGKGGVAVGREKIGGEEGRR